MYARPSLNDHFSGNDFTNILPPKFITFHPETGNECEEDNKNEREDQNSS